MTFNSIFRSDLFSGQVGIVTGGGSGIGRCIGHELSSLGAKVVLASRDITKCEAVRDEIVEDGGEAVAMSCNVRKEEEIKSLISDVVKEHGRLDFLVNNAGGQFASPIESISIRGWNAVVETNLTGTFLLCREAVSQYMSDNGGAIVNIVADMWSGMPMMSHSGAARAGVVNFTKTSAMEWAPSHVRVNAVAPGLILSSGFKNYPEPVLDLLKSLPDQIPAARFGTESEVSAAVVYLLSPAAAYVTGETLRVDGASSLYRRTFPIPNHEPAPGFSGFHRSADLPEGLAPQE